MTFAFIRGYLFFDTLKWLTINFRVRTPPNFFIHYQFDWVCLSPSLSRAYHHQLLPLLLGPAPFVYLSLHSNRVAPLPLPNFGVLLVFYLSDLLLVLSLSLSLSLSLFYFLSLPLFLWPGDLPNVRRSFAQIEERE